MAVEREMNCGGGGIGERWAESKEWFHSINFKHERNYSIF